jgi:hypothetical protein
VAFVVAVVALLATGIAAARCPADARVGGTAALLFAGLVTAYAVSRTTGIPLLQTDPEPIDAVGVATSVVEAVGFACALVLTQSTRHNRVRPALQEVSR